MLQGDDNDKEKKHLQKKTHNKSTKAPHIIRKIQEGEKKPPRATVAAMKIRDGEPHSRAKKKHDATIFGKLQRSMAKICMGVKNDIS